MTDIDAGIKQRAAEIAGARKTVSSRLEKAEVMTKCIHDAIVAGCEHYNEAGDKLPDVLSVLRALRDEGTVTVLQPGGVAEREAYGFSGIPRQPRVRRTP